MLDDAVCRTIERAKEVVKVLFLLLGNEIVQEIASGPPEPHRNDHFGRVAVRLFCLSVSKGPHCLLANEQRTAWLLNELGNFVAVVVVVVVFCGFGAVVGEQRVQ